MTHQTPDPIDQAIARLRHLYPQMNPARLEALEQDLREQFGGEYARTAKRSKRDLETLNGEIVRLWLNHKVTTQEIAYALGIHRSTAARVLGNLRNAP